MVKTKKSDLEKFAGMVMDELHEFRAEVSERFESVDKRFDKVEARLDSLETEMRAMRFEVAGSTTSRP